MKTWCIKYRNQKVNNQLYNVVNFFSSCQLQIYKMSLDNKFSNKNENIADESHQLRVRDDLIILGET